MELKKPAEKELGKFAEECSKLQFMMINRESSYLVENKISSLKSMLTNINRMYKLDPEDDEQHPSSKNPTNSMTSEDIKNIWESINTKD